jgi:hypothetical protein
MTPRSRGDRSAPTARLTVGRRFFVLMLTSGLMLAAAAAIGGEVRLAAALLVGFALIGAAGLLPGELSAARFDRADERQRLMLFESIAVSDYLTRPVLLVGAAWEVSRGNPGPFLLIGVVGSITEIGAVLVLPKVR